MPGFIKQIEPETAAVLVIDMSNDFIAPGSPNYVEEGYRFVPALAEFLEKCRSGGIKRMIYMTHSFRGDCKDMTYVNRAVMGIWPAGRRQPPPEELVEGTWGTEIYEGCRPREQEIVLKKQHYSSFKNTALDTILRAAGIRTVAITGVCTDCCCAATAQDAFCRGYDVAVLRDLTGTAEWLRGDCGYGTVSEEKTRTAIWNSLYATCADVMESEKFLKCAGIHAAVTGCLKKEVEV